MGDTREVVSCGSCGAKFRIPVDVKKFRCPKCKAANVVDSAVVAAVKVTEAPTSAAIHPAALADVLSAAPSNTATAPQVIDPSAVMKRTVIAGLLLGVVLAAAILFFLRPMFGVWRVGFLLGVLAAVPIIQIIIQLLKVPDSSTPPVGTRPSTTRRLVTFQAVALVLPLIALLAEAVAPPQGVVAGILTAARAPDPSAKLQLPPAFSEPLRDPNTIPKPAPKQPFPAAEMQAFSAKAKERPAERNAKKTKPPTDRELWARADFLLVNPTHYAVAIKDTGTPEKPVFEVLIEGEDDDAIDAQKIAWETKTPVIGVDRNLTREVFHTYAPSDRLETELGTQVHNLFERRILVPKNSKIVAYFDKINNLRRVGHVLNSSDDRFEFVDLLPRRGVESDQPFEVEQIVRAERVQADSEQRDLNDLSLRTSVDFLDYCVYQVLRTIQHAPKETYQTGDPFVFVDDVVADVADYEARLKPLRDQEDKAWSELRSDNTPTRTANLLDLFSKVIVDREEELARRQARDIRRNTLLTELESLKAQVNQLRALLDAEKRLTSEIRSRLVRTGIKQVERSDRAQNLITNKVSGKNWIKPGSEEAVTSHLVQATHLLLTDIRQPEQSGRYQLSMRVVDVLTGEILWEDQGDRGELGSSTTSYGDLTSATVDKLQKLTGIWQSPGGDRAEIIEQTAGKLHINVTTKDQTKYSIVATRYGDKIGVDSCAASHTRSKRNQDKQVACEIRYIDSRTIDIGCAADSSPSRPFAASPPLRWATFRKDE